MHMFASFCFFCCLFWLMFLNVFLSWLCMVFVLICSLIFLSVWSIFVDFSWMFYCSVYVVVFEECFLFWGAVASFPSFSLDFPKLGYFLDEKNIFK